MILDIFRKKHTRAELEAALATFDEQTLTMEARIAELRSFTSDGLAREAVVGELDKDSAADLKKARAELLGLVESQEGRGRAREKLAQALAAAFREERRIESAKRREAVERWGKDFGAALDGVADALRGLSSVIVTAQRTEGACPVQVTGLMNRAGESFIRGLLEGLYNGTAGDYGISPDRFAAALAHLEGSKSRAVYFATEAVGQERAG